MRAEICRTCPLERSHPPCWSNPKGRSRDAEADHAGMAVETHSMALAGDDYRTLWERGAMSFPFWFKGVGLYTAFEEKFMVCSAEVLP
jgi:hypothetical protein